MDYMNHSGIKGQKWGIRRYQNPDGTYTEEGKKRRRTAGEVIADFRDTRRAKKDAKEFATAKMYYGQGAGIRRRTIKEQVNQRSKNPVYKKAFDEALEKQDMSRAAQRAQHQRTRADISNAVAGRRSKVASSAIVTAAAAASFYLANKQSIDAMVGPLLNSARTSVGAAATRASVEIFLRTHGVK